MFKKIKQIKNEFLGINQRNVQYIYPNNPKKHYRLADNKVLTKKVLSEHGIQTPETYGIIEHIGQIDQIWDKVSAHEKLVIKPAMGRGGSGIMILSRKGSDWFNAGIPISTDYIFSHIANIVFGLFSFADEDCAIIERCIIPHHFFGELYPAGVPDIRVITFHNKAVMAMLRMPTKQSNGKANLHQGGLGIGIDMESGSLLEAYDGKTYHRAHPDSGIQIVDKILPHWEEIKKLALKTSQHFPLKYLGIDIVVDNDLGPEVIEINIRPGLGIQMANKQGLKSILNLKNIAA